MDNTRELLQELTLAEQRARDWELKAESLRFENRRYKQAILQLIMERDLIMQDLKDEEDCDNCSKYKGIGMCQKCKWVWRGIKKCAQTR